MLCSVVIPARNAGQTVGETILGALSQSVPRELYEVIVIDDGSSDHTAVIARKAGVKVVPQPPLGLAAARNTGARAARGELVVFLDPDCVPQLEWLAQMIAPFDDSRVVGVKGAYVTQEETLVSRLIQADFDEQYRRLGRYKSIDVVDGYSAAFRRSVFLAAGGFDTTFASGYDVELSYRLNKSGQRLVFAPKACVYHYHGETLRPFLERALRDGLWRSLVYARHPDKPRVDGKIASEFRTQLPLAGLTVASLVLGARWRRFLPFAGLCAATFATSAVPTAWRSRRAGTDVVFTFPGLHFVRVLALGIGMTIGAITLGWQQLVTRVNQLTRAMRR
jgi:GT2 family glycosyltransferase